MPPRPAPHFLITNDDGYFAPGIQALVRAVSRLGSVSLVAPDREQSASGHSLTLHTPLRVHAIGKNRWSVSGTPTDCVNVALHHLLPTRPTMVLAGINNGSNLGNDVTYSGTVAAAMEGSLIGVPSIAFSQRLDRRPGAAPPDYAAAARQAVRIVRILLARPLPPGMLLNVNFPVEWNGDAVCVRLGNRHYDEAVTRRHDPMGKPYYWIGGAIPTWREEAGTDYAAIKRGAISLTPLQLDLTHYQEMALLAPLAKSLAIKRATVKPRAKKTAASRN